MRPPLRPLFDTACLDITLCRSVTYLTALFRSLKCRGVVIKCISWRWAPQRTSVSLAIVTRSRSCREVARSSEREPLGLGRGAHQSAGAGCLSDAMSPHALPLCALLVAGLGLSEWGNHYLPFAFAGLSCGAAAMCSAGSLRRRSFCARRRLPSKRRRHRCALQPTTRLPTVVGA